jgi:hypothetical protein
MLPKAVVELEVKLSCAFTQRLVPPLPVMSVLGIRSKTCCTQVSSAFGYSPSYVQFKVLKLVINTVAAVRLCLSQSRAGQGSMICSHRSPLGVGARASRPCKPDETSVWTTSGVSDPDYASVPWTLPSGARSTQLAKQHILQEFALGTTVDVHSQV